MEPVHDQGVGVPHPPLPPSNPFTQLAGVRSIADGSFAPLYANQVRPNIGVVAFSQRDQSGVISKTCACCTATLIAKDQTTLVFVTNAHGLGGKERAQILTPNGPAVVDLLTNPLLKLLKDTGRGRRQGPGVEFNIHDIEAANMCLEVFLWTGPDQPHDHYSAQLVRVPLTLAVNEFYRYQTIHYQGVLQPAQKFCCIGGEQVVMSGSDAAIIVTSRECGGRWVQLPDFYYAFSSMPDYAPFGSHPEFSHCNVVGLPSLPEELKTCRNADGSRDLLETTVQASSIRVLGYKQASQWINNPSSNRDPVVAETNCLGRVGSSGSLLELAESGETAIVDRQSKTRKSRVVLVNGIPHRIIVGMACGTHYDQHNNPTGGTAVVLGQAMIEFLSWGLRGYPGWVALNRPLTDIPANCLSFEAITPYDGRSSKATIEIRFPAQGRTYTPGGSPHTVPIFGPALPPPINLNTRNHFGAQTERDLSQDLLYMAKAVDDYVRDNQTGPLEPRLIRVAERLEHGAQLAEYAAVGLDNPPASPAPNDGENARMRDLEQQVQQLQQQLLQEQQGRTAFVQEHAAEKERLNRNIQREKATLQQQLEQQQQQREEEWKERIMQTHEKEKDALRHDSEQRLHLRLRQEEEKHAKEKEHLQHQLQQQHAEEQARLLREHREEKEALLQQQLRQEEANHQEEKQRLQHQLQQHELQFDQQTQKQLKEKERLERQLREQKQKQTQQQQQLEAERAKHRAEQDRVHQQLQERDQQLLRFCLLLMCVTLFHCCFA